jgi:hypothetical protein
MSRAFPTQGYFSDSIFIRYQNVLTACQKLNVRLTQNFKLIQSGTYEVSQDGIQTEVYISGQANALTEAYAASIGAPAPY